MSGLHVELQWQVNQNKIAVGLLKITFYSLGKVQVYCFLSLLRNLLNIPCLTFSEQDSNLKPDLHISPGAKPL